MHFIHISFQHTFVPEHPIISSKIFVVIIVMFPFNFSVMLSCVFIAFILDQSSWRSVYFISLFKESVLDPRLLGEMASSRSINERWNNLLHFYQSFESEKWYLIITLICIFVLLIRLSIFSDICWPFVLLGITSAHSLHIFSSSCFFYWFGIAVYILWTQHRYFSILKL